MFTGLILEMGEVASIQSGSSSAILSFKAGSVAATAKIGDSIAVNGVCLTVVNKENNLLSFDLSNETLSSTNLGSLKRGAMVNLEPSLRPDSKIGGHFVTGHVDAVGKISAKTKMGDMFKIEIEAPARVVDFLVEKGSVAVDGISLTVVDVLRDGFTIVIIPHTAKLTTIGFKEVGATVNLEADILGKYVARFLGKERTGDSGLMKALTEGGYTQK